MILASAALLLYGAGCNRAAPESAPAPARSAPVVPAITEADIQYFDSHPLMIPVEGVSPRELRDSFNEGRSEGRTHRATDILAPRGTPVIAAIDGQVVRLSQSSAGGITAYLVDDQAQYLYYYAHLDHYSDQVTPGLRVKQGFVIGYVGTSGNAPPDTPHLHFQVMRLEPGKKDWWNGTPVDVRSFMKTKGKVSE